MPETPNTAALPRAETPGEKTMRRFYEGRLAEQLMQAASMERNRQMLRRGALKMQDGTLGEAKDPAEEEPVNISIGDVIQYLPQPAPAPTPTPDPAPATPPATATPAWKKIAATAALLASGAGAGAGVPWLVGALSKAPAAAVQPAAQADEDTWLDVRLSQPKQEGSP